MNNDKTKSRLPDLANEIREWLIGKYSHVLRFSLLILVVALVSLASFRLTVGGIKEYAAVDSAAVLTTAIQLFAIMNPVSAIPIFLSFTSRLENYERQKIVNTTTTIIIALLFTFSLFGPLVLEALNVCARARSGTQAIINVLIGAVVATVGVYLTLRFSPFLVSLLGKNGVRTVSRIMSVILAAVAAQMIHSALWEWGIAKA